MPGPAYRRTSGGTLFLDEITEMSPIMQITLLRVIQDKEALSLGATAPVKIDVRFIAATNRDVLEIVKQGGLSPGLLFPSQRRQPAHSRPRRAQGRRAAAGPPLPA